ncbi:MAG: hypothetical protein ACE5D8_02790 [Fidelibacterota bacterium]
MIRYCHHILVLLIYCFLTRVSAQDTLHILYTNNTNGALENCYCPDHPLGSLEKRSVFIREFRQKHPQTLVLDAGDFWGVTDRLLLKDSLVTAAYAQIGYDAILPGDQEITRTAQQGLSWLSDLKADIVVANLAAPELPGKRSYKIITVGSTRIGITGIIGSSALKYYPETLKNRITLLPPAKVLGQIIPEMREQCDFVIVLSHQGLDQDRKLAQKNLDIDIIIGAHSQSRIDSTIQVGRTTIVQAGKEGYYVGILSGTVLSGSKTVNFIARLEPMTLDLPDDPFVMRLIEEFETQTGIINRRKLRLQRR